MTDIAYSVNNVPIRLTGEYWRPIIIEHPEMRGYRKDCLAAIESQTW